MHDALVYVPPPPCDTCKFQRFCAQREMVCLAFRRYVVSARCLAKDRVPDMSVRAYRQNEYRNELAAVARKGSRSGEAKAA